MAAGRAVRSVAMSPLRDGSGTAVGYRLAITTTGTPDMRPGEAIEYTGVLSQFAPVADHTGARVYSTQLDNAGTTSSWTLPR